MKKLAGLILFVVFAGCACQSKEIKTTTVDKQDLYRQVIDDTNASLTQCRDENVALHRALRKLEANKKKNGRNR
jgi:hypothetical protein